MVDALTRIQRFLDENGDALGGVNGSEGRKTIDEVADQLRGKAVTQGTRNTAKIGERANSQRLSRTLRLELMHPVAEMAAARADQIPQAAALRMPATVKGGTRLISAARSMADAAAPYAAAFVSGGLAANFLDRLRAGASALEASLIAHVDHTQNRQQATIGINSVAKRARSAIKMVSAAVVQHLSAQPELVAQWHSIKRLPRRTTTQSAVTPVGVPVVAGSAA